MGLKRTFLLLTLLLAGCGGNLADPSSATITLPTFVLNGATDDGTQNYHCRVTSDEVCDSTNGCNCSALPGIAKFDPNSGVLRWTPDDSLVAPAQITITKVGNERTESCRIFSVDPLSANDGEIVVSGSQCP